MSLLGLKEGTCGLAPLSMTRYLFFCPEGIQIKGTFLSKGKYAEN